MIPEKYTVLDPKLWFSIFYSRLEIDDMEWDGEDMTLVDYNWHKLKKEESDLPDSEYGNDLSEVDSHDTFTKYICKFYKQGYIPAHHVQITNDNITNMLRKIPGDKSKLKAVSCCLMKWTTQTTYTVVATLFL